MLPPLMSSVFWNAFECPLTGNNLGLSLYTVPQSAVVCVVAYFRRTELLPGVQERSGILIRVRIEHVKDINL